MVDETIAILLIEDIPEHARLIRAMLAEVESPSVTVTTTGQLSTGLICLAQTGADVILLDLFLPDSQGLDTLNSVSLYAPEIPIVVLTAMNDQKLTSKALQAGAQDYLIKERLNSDTLGRALCYAIERQSQRRELQARETRLHTIIQSNADGIIVTNRDGVVRFVNPAAEALFSRKAEEMLGTPFGFPTVAGKPAELDIPQRSGQALVAEMRVVEVEWDDEPAALASLRDITERKRLEREIHQQAVKLEARNEELKAFSSALAHDLKTPLVSIVGFVDLLLKYKRKDASPVEQEFLDNIREAALEMTEMTDALLLLAQLAHVEEIMTEVKMASVIRTALVRLRNAIEGRGVQIIVKPDLPSVLGHGPWLEQVFFNLIDNAIKYIGEDNPDPRITIRGFRQNGRSVRYEVWDNGVGISPQDQEHLFEMFSRFHTAHAPGLGLGLSIVYRIVTKLDGTVGVESAPGQGSTFWFILNAPM